jgi:hypothetical protein
MEWLIAAALDLDDSSRVFVRIREAVHGTHRWAHLNALGRLKKRQKVDVSRRCLAAHLQIS